MRRALAGSTATLVAIGPGTPAELRRLRGELGLEGALLLSDPSFAAYRAYGLGRAGRARLLLSPRLWLAYARLLLRGRRPRLPRQDVRELGGDAVVDRDGRLVFAHRSRSVVDRADPERIAALVRTLEAGSASGGTRPGGA